MSSFSSSFSLDTALTNLSNAFDNIQTLIIAVTYVIAVSLLVTGIMKFRIFANQTFGSAQRGEMMGPIVHILIGALLLYIPSTLTSSLQTVYGTTAVGQTSDLIAYQSLAGTEKWQNISDVVVMYMKLIGLIAFVRGWVILSKVGGQHGQPNSMGKGMIHIIGGILLINVIDTVKILACTFGYSGATC